MDGEKPGRPLGCFLVPRARPAIGERNDSSSKYSDTVLAGLAVGGDDLGFEGSEYPTLVFDCTIGNGIGTSGVGWILAGCGFNGNFDLGNEYWGAWAIFGGWIAGFGAGVSTRDAAFGNRVGITLLKDKTTTSGSGPRKG